MKRASVARARRFGGHAHRQLGALIVVSFDPDGSLRVVMPFLQRIASDMETQSGPQ